MPVFRLTDSLIFPDPDLADEEGLLAVGGDLSPERLLLAYSMGIFPWYSRRSPILWWSPDPRLLLIPSEIKMSRSLRQTIRKNIFRITVDTAFSEVIRKCASVHTKEDGETWITKEMLDAYTRLHELGFAHSVEIWRTDDLVGGLYGISLGKAFFGESMFSLEADASKVALVHLADILRSRGFLFIDCQVTTSHLMRMGAREIGRPEFIVMLKKALQTPISGETWRDG